MKTRFERSASLYADAIDTPVPANERLGNARSRVPFQGEHSTSPDDLLSPNATFLPDDNTHCIIDGAGVFKFESIRNKYENFQSEENESKYSTFLDEINAEGERDNYDLSDLDLEADFPAVASSSRGPREDLARGDTARSALLDEDCAALATPIHALSARDDHQQASRSPSVGVHVYERHIADLKTPYFQKVSVSSSHSKDDCSEDIHRSPASASSKGQKSFSSPRNDDGVDERESTPRHSHKTRVASISSKQRSFPRLSFDEHSPVDSMDSGFAPVAGGGGDASLALGHRPTYSLSSTGSAESLALSQLDERSKSSRGSSKIAVSHSHSHSAKTSLPQRILSTAHLRNKSIESDCASSYAEAPTLTTGDSLSQRIVDSGDPRFESQRELLCHDGDIAQSDLSQSTGGGDHSVSEMGNSDADHRDKIASPSLTPFSTVAASLTSSQEPDFLRSVESRPSRSPADRRVFPGAAEEDGEEILPTVLDDDMASEDSYPENEDHFSRNEQGTSIKSKYSNLLLSSIHNGDVEKVHEILDESRGCSVVGPAEASTLLLQYASGMIEEVPRPLYTMIILIDFLQADVNATDAARRTPLHYLTHNPELGALLLERGADILQCDETDTCPLSLSLNSDQDWLLNRFEACGGEARLLQGGSADALFKYATFLILAGYSKKAETIIRKGRVTITPDDATALLSSCTGNFEKMKEPVETYELLESLGARLDDM